MNVPEKLKYAESHEWVLLEGDIATVGITEHAQAELTDIVYAELPMVGRRVVVKETVAVVESVKAASDIYSPLSGEVTEVNAALDSNPALLNSDPFGEGWLFKLKIADASEMESLKSAAGYEDQIRG
ncbi:MAG TPA: glycine cleavage system protein GcvH [Chthoniobacterales bacterium]|jgi:glycine cleavage system H protein